MKTYSVRKFLALLANGASMETMVKNNVLAKAYRFSSAKSGVTSNDTTLVTKEAAEAVKQMRLESNVSEGDVMKALGLDDVNQYVAWESGQATIELTPENFTALAKVLKTDVATLAAKMVSADGPNPVLDGDGEPASSGGDGSVGGDQNNLPGSTTPPAKSATGATANDIAKSKSAGRSAQIFKIEAANIIDKSTDVEKAKVRSELMKSVAGIGKISVNKGSIVAEDFSPNNVLSPELGTELLSVLVDQSEFLKKIQMRPMSRQSCEVLVWDISGRKLGRAKPGWPTSADLQRGINKSKTLNATKCTLEWVLENRTLLNYQNNVPMLESEIFNGFTLQFRNDMVDLAFNGLDDNWDTIIAAGGTPAFTDLGTGFFTLANAKAPAAQIINATTLDALYDNTNHTTGNFVPLNAMKTLIQKGIATNPRFFDTVTDFVLGTADWEAHEDYILSSQYAQATQLLSTGLEKKYKGRPITMSNYITPKNMIHTTLRNYIIGLVTGDQGADGIVIERHIIPEGVLYRAIVYLDFDFVNYDAIALAHS